MRMTASQNESFLLLVLSLSLFLSITMLYKTIPNWQQFLVSFAVSIAHAAAVLDFILKII